MIFNITERLGQSRGLDLVSPLGSSSESLGGVIPCAMRLGGVQWGHLGIYGHRRKKGGHCHGSLHSAPVYFLVQCHQKMVLMYRETNARAMEAISL